MARSRTIRIGPPVRGLTDFPEHATPAHATQAMNVEFVHGSVRTRRGTARLSNNIYTEGGAGRAAIIKLVRAFQMPSGTQMVAIGIVPLAGADALTERFLFRWLSSGTIAGPPGEDVAMHGAVNNFHVNASASSRWDLCSFQGYGSHGPRTVVCSDHTDPDVASVYAWPFGWGPVGGPANFPLTAEDRALFPFHGGVYPNSGLADDPWEYLARLTPLRARFCRPHHGRLVLGNIDMPKVDDRLGEHTQSFIWASNLQDIRGWPFQNLFSPPGGDQGNVTGLAGWQDYLVVFRRTSISLFLFKDTYPPLFRPVLGDKGCVAHDTIVEDVLGRVLFLAADGFYAFDGNSVQYLSQPIERTLRAKLGTGVSGSYAVHYPASKQVWLVLTGGQYADPDTVFVMDYHRWFPDAEQDRSPAWSVFEFQSGSWLAGAAKKVIGGLAVDAAGRRLFGVTRDTLANPLDQVNYEQFDVGDAIDSQGASLEAGYVSRWESGPIQWGKAAVNRWRYIRPLIRPTATTGLTAWWRRDGQGFDIDNNHNGQSVTWDATATTGGAALGAFVLGTDRLGGGADHQEVRLDVHRGGRGRNGYVGVETSAGLSDKFEIQTLEIDVLDIEGKR